MAIYTSLSLTLKIATDVELTKLLQGRDKEVITDTFDEYVGGVVDIAVSTTFTVPMTHITTGQFLYIETTNPIALHFSGGSDDVLVAPPAVGTKVRVILERASFTGLTIENQSALLVADAVTFVVLGT